MSVRVSPLQHIVWETETPNLGKVKVALSHDQALTLANDLVVACMELEQGKAEAKEVDRVMRHIHNGDVIRARG